MDRVYFLRDVAKKYVSVFVKFIETNGIDKSKEWEYNLFKDALEDLLLLGKVKNYDETRYKLVKLLKQKLNLKKLSAVDRRSVVGYCLAYYVASGCIGGRGLNYYDVVVEDSNISISVGSDLSEDRVKSILVSLFDNKYKCKKAGYPKDGWILLSSINNAKVKYAGMRGVIYLEYSDLEARNKLKELL